jgi:hypothetical protein
MPVIYQKIIKREDLKANPSVLYLFGDNEVRQGFGGQAKEMRGEPNAVGVATKRFPNMDENAFWSDDNYKSNTAIILHDLFKARRHLSAGGLVVIPLDGLGTGASQMPQRCPDTFKYLREQLSTLDR